MSEQSPFRAVSEIGLHPGSPDEDLLIEVLDKIKGRGGKTEYLHMLLNRGLFVLRQKIKELQDKGLDEREMLEHFSLQNATLYRVAFLYFEAQQNIEGGLLHIKSPTKSPGLKQAAQQVSIVSTTTELDQDLISNTDNQPTDNTVVKPDIRPAGKGKWSTLRTLATGNAEANNE